MISEKDTILIMKAIMYSSNSSPVYPVVKNHKGACQNDHITPTINEPLINPAFFSMDGSKNPLQPVSSPVAPSNTEGKKPFNIAGYENVSILDIVTPFRTDTRYTPIA